MMTQRARGTFCSAQRLERAQAGIDRIAVVGAAAAVELVALQHRDPRPRALGPALHLGLLVEMAVEQHGVVAVARHFDEDQRRAAREPHHLQGGARKPCELRRGPAHHQLDGILHVAVLDPLRIEVRRLVGDADVLGDRGEDRVVPEGIDELFQAIVSMAARPMQAGSIAEKTPALCPPAAASSRVAGAVYAALLLPAVAGAQPWWMSARPTSSAVCSASRLVIRCRPMSSSQDDAALAVGATARRRFSKPLAYDRAPPERCLLLGDAQ